MKATFLGKKEGLMVIIVMYLEVIFHKQVYNLALNDLQESIAFKLYSS